MTPAISVLLPVYNGGAFLGKAIESILQQSFADFEFIIINDGSKDGSGDVINHYAAQDKRIVAVHQPNAGLITTLNRGLEMARAPLIARMDADDIALPHRFARQFKFMNDNPQIAICGSNIRLINQHDIQSRDILYPVTPEQVKAMMPQGSPLAHPTVMMRRDIIVNAGGYRRMYKHAEDYDLWLRIGEQHAIANIPDVLLLYRQHDDKVSFQHAKQQALSTFAAQLASKMRLAGKQDPTENLDCITTESLSLFNLTQEQQADLRYKIVEYELDTHMFGNDAKPVLACINEIETLRREIGCGHLLAMFYLKCALFYGTNKNIGAALLNGFKAVFANPVFVFKKLGFKALKTAYAVARKIKHHLFAHGK